MTEEIKVRLVDSEGQSPGLEKLKLIITLVASIVIPLMIFYAGKSIEQSGKERELAVKYIEISVGILKEAPSQGTTNLREWAIKNINRYAEEELSESVISELKTESLPAQRVDSVQSRNFTVPAAPRDIKYIVVTDSETPSLKSLRNAVSESNAGASYHYLVAVDGEIVKAVDEENIAWHAGVSEWQGETNLNEVSIGIGLVHLATADGENWLGLDKTHPAVGPDYPGPQLAALENLLFTLAKKYQLSPDNIITKQDIAPDRRKSDLYGQAMASLRERVRTRLDQ